MHIPTEEEWEMDKYGECLDVKWAYKNFFGKSLEEAEALFVENAIVYQEDVCYYMPSVPFRYYVRAYMNYLNGELSFHDSDAASCFLGLMKWRLEHDPQDALYIWPEAVKTMAHIQANPDCFDWTERIYGNLEERIENVFQLKKEAENLPPN